MKPEKTKLIWSISIAAALLVILLQGYWLYNQYRFTLEKNTDAISEQILLAWDDYKMWRKARLNSQLENVKSYNMNLNKETPSGHPTDFKNITTDWTLSFQIVKNRNKQLSINGESLKMISHGTEERQISREADENSSPSKKEEIRQTDTTKIWEEKIIETDSTLLNTFRFRTTENQHLVLEAVDLVLTDLNTPFKISEMDSLVQQKTAYSTIRIDTLSLPSDSVLWHPNIIYQLSFAHPSVTVEIPYNILKRKIASITIPVAPSQIIKTMGVQIIISIILVLVLIVCLLLQIQTISRQQRINKLRQNFVNTTVHELKRPVQTLKTIVSYLQQSSPEEQEMLNDARIETDNLTSYLQKLREVNQAETMSGSLHLSYFDFTALLTDCIENLQKNAGKQLHIETSFPATPLSITADKMIMSNIVINLLENAVKYSGDTPVIRVNAGINSKRLFFSISDNGIGIAASEQSHIFEPFFRSKNDYVASLPGMGLGLSYVKIAVEAHRGVVEVLSKPNWGTTITVKIPQQ